MTTITNTMSANAPATTLTHRWGWLLALGVVQIIVGSIAIAVPVVASPAQQAYKVVAPPEGVADTEEHARHPSEQSAFRLP